MIKKRPPVHCGMTGKEIPPEDAGLCNNAEGCYDCEHNDDGKDDVEPPEVDRYQEDKHWEGRDDYV